MERAARSFHSAVRACPSVSIQVHTTAAPYSRASDKKRSKRVPGAEPSSRLTEFRRGLPAMRCRPVSMTGASVESSMSGTVAWVAKRPTTSAMSEMPSSPV